VKHTARLSITASPKFNARVQAEPISCRCGLEGSVHARIGAINARVGRVPIVLAVPFLGGVQTIGAVGPFDVSTGPVDVEIERFELHGDCVLDGLTVGLEGEASGSARIDLDGTLAGRVARASLEFGERDEEEAAP